MSIKVPLVDLKAQLKEIKPAIEHGINEVLEKCNFVLGEEVQQLERAFAQACGAKYGIGCASGTDALELALRAANVGPGDDVIVPAHTFIATPLAATACGARPVLVDIDESNFFLDVSKIKLTSKIKAVLPVHLYGRMMDLSPLLELGHKHAITIIEDACQAHGAELNGKKAGTVGAMGCFSFYPGKNLGGYGDGGIVLTSNEELKTKLESLRNYGSPKKYHHPLLGMNSRLDTIQAAILLAKLPGLARGNEKRYRVARKYHEALSNVGDLILPELPPMNTHVFHLYVIRTQKRDALLEHLNKNGIGAGIHYPTPIHLHGAYANLGHKKGDFPVAERICNEILSLPIYPEITDEQIYYVVDQVRHFFS
jgi:dTDP-4-amino-4,6-dideoxygalactose transaminase